MNDKDEILAALAAGFNQIEGRFAAVDERFDALETRMGKLDERQQYLEMKIDRRFDLLENMMLMHRREDAGRIKELEVRVSKLEAAVA